MLHLELQIKYQNNRGFKSPKWSGAQLVQDPVGSRTCRVNPRFEGSSPSRSAFAVMAQLVQHWS